MGGTSSEYLVEMCPQPYSSTVLMSGKRFEHYERSKLVSLPCSSAYETLCLVLEVGEMARES